MTARGSNRWKRAFAKSSNRWKTRAAVLPILGIFTASAPAQTVVQDGFETGSFDPAWTKTAGVTIQTGTGAKATANYAVLPPLNNLGARFDAVSSGGAQDFHVDFCFRVTNSALRQFNLHISDSTGATGSGAPTVNLRYQGAWAAYQGSTATWRPLTGLVGTVTGAWHRMRLSGTNWGNTNAAYGIELSGPGGTNFTSSVAGLTWYQGGNPSNRTARYFNFTTDFGPSAAFDVDEIAAAVTVSPYVEPDAVTNISGTYPHLSVFSAAGEIGIGAIVPWAGRIWFVTYPPHEPNGSADKLWTIDTNLTLAARPESVGGTHANRLIHRESQQLIIGPYFIDTNAAVRRVLPATMPGRLTATARHLVDPTNRVYFATMEEGFYEVDVNTLAVTTLKADAQTQTGGNGLILAGNHGKGCYAGQGRLVYANNGETSWSVAGDPGFNSPAGLLAENTGADFTNGWSTLERRNFTEVTGPGGILGATNDNDVLWSLGWDKRSVMLKLLDGGAWRDFRLPKGSYTHDAYLGWYTEWPRIREINPGTLLMHMHGLFYEFPKTFSAANTAGLAPVCTYLKMPVDYCWWDGRIVMARDETSTTGGNIWAGQSHSAPWFGQLDDLRQWGAPAGFGGPWKGDSVTNGAPGVPFLVSGFARRALHLRHGSTNAVNFALEVDATGAGAWTNIATINVPTNGYAWLSIPASVAAIWARLTPDQNATNVTAFFHLGNPPTAAAPGLFAGIADATGTVAGCDGILRPRGGDATVLQFAANLLGSTGQVTGTGYYEIGGPLKLRATTNAAAEAALRNAYGLTNAGFTVEAASVLYTESANRFRLPKSLAAYDAAFASGWPRGAREVITERRLFNAHGTFYELPYADSGGFRRVRPVATHRKRISDFASWRGLFVIAGVAGAATNDGHVIRSEDDQAALWFGNVDDLWRMGAPSGTGGPWKDSAVTNGAASDPYLMFGYERKELALSHGHASPVTFTVEVDFAADNTWSEYARFTVAPGETFTHVFPDGYSAHWVRIKSDTTATASAQFAYTSAPAPAGYDAWSQAHALATGPAGDPDGDGFANLLEYATGGNPTNGDAVSRLAAARTNGVLALRFTRSTHAVDATLLVEGSPAVTNDAPWQGIAVNSNGVWSGGAVVAETGTDPANVSVQDSVAASTNRFLRLRVTRP